MYAQGSTPSRLAESEAFPRARRIGARREFRDTYEHGVKQHGRLVAVFAQDRAEGGIRLGITATRKAGGAVLRNRARRRVREIFRRWAARTPDARLDVVVNISARAARAPFTALSGELTALLERAVAGAVMK